jgi:predicted nuclease of predicted toxin-antitoxin system
MKILFDQGTPVPLRRYFADHTVTTAYEQGWSDLANGHLLATAERAGYDLFITTDQNLRYQQQVTGRQLAIVVLRSTSWPRIQHHITAIQAVVARITAGGYEEIEIPR